MPVYVNDFPVLSTVLKETLSSFEISIHSGPSLENVRHMIIFLIISLRSYEIEHYATFKIVLTFSRGTSLTNQ